jgi:4-amino-4-deoxy-L-arabinose transferase-like glycosyltransferase
VAAALAFLSAPLFAGLGGTDLDGDEAIYAGVVERMAAGGSWITPTDENGPFLEKPPLRFWLVAGAMKVGLLEPTESGHRLLDATLSAAALGYVFLIARGLGGTVAGLGAAFLLVIQPELLLVHGLRSGTLEPLLVLSWCGAIHHFLRWTEGRRRDAFLVAAWCAAAALAKTVVVIPLAAVLVLATGLVPEWRARAIAERGTWGRAAALFAGLALPWFALQLLLHGARFGHSMFIEHVVTRVTAAVDPTHLQPWWFYLDFVGRAAARGWPYLVVGAVAMAVSPRLRPAGVLLALWLILPVALFSMAASKLVHYVYPALLALAVLGGQAFGAAARLIGDVRARAPLPPRARLVTGAIAVIALAVAAVVAIVGPMQMDAGPLHARTAGPVRPLVVAAAAGLALLGRRRAAVAALAGALALSEVGREHGRALERVRVRHRPLGAFVACVAAHSEVPRQVRVSVGRPLFRDERYYLARVGWRDWAPDAVHLTRMVRDPDRDAPHVLDFRAYQSLVPAIASWPPETRAGAPLLPLRGHDLVALLPGRFRPCAAAGEDRIP